MAFLVTLLAPHIVEAGANIGTGLYNAIQGDSSSVSFQIGSKVFSTRKGFNLGTLPPELRARILLMALSDSQSLVLPKQYMFDPFLGGIREVQRQLPLNVESDSELYRSIVGDYVSANGYPIGAWRWQLVSAEWRDVLRAPLWRALDVCGSRSYMNLMKWLDTGGDIDVLHFVKSIVLREGFQAPSDLYKLLCCPHLEKLDSISILPDYPTPYDPLISHVTRFEFGLQMIRTKRPIKSLIYGMPLEMTTNEVSRQHLAVLSPSRLGVTFIHPSITIFKELEKLVAETTDLLEIRYIPRNDPVPPEVLLCNPLQSFKRIHLYLLLPPNRQSRPIRLGGLDVIQQDSQTVTTWIAQLISGMEIQSEEVQERYTIYRVEDWDIPIVAHKSTKRKLWPIRSASTEPASDTKGTELVLRNRATGSGTKEEAKQEKKHWERQTNLRLLGGFVNLRLESKKN